MSLNLKRPAIIASAAALAAGLALAGGSLAAGGAGGAASDPPDFAGDLARALSAQTGQTITADQVKAAQKALLKEHLDAAVKEGRLTQAQADRMLERADQGLPPMLGPGGPGRHGRGGHARVTNAVATLMKITPAELRTRLREGDETLAEEAAKAGVSRDQVVAAVKKAILDGKGRFTPTDAQAQQMAEDIADGAAPPRGGPHGPGGPDGPGLDLRFEPRFDRPSYGVAP